MPKRLYGGSAAADGHEATGQADYLYGGNFASGGQASSGNSNYLYGGNIAAEGHSFSRRAEEIDNFLLQGDPRFSAPIEAAQDPSLSFGIQNSSLANTSTIRYGRVQMVLPHANWYRVALEDNGGELPCVKLGGNAGYRLMGTKDASIITPDSRVFVLKHITGDYGYIIGVIPELNEDGNHSYADWVSQGSNVGILRQRYYTEYMRLLEDQGGALNHSSDRPLDALSFDWTQIAETGIGMHIDPFMCWMRVDEECGIFCFYHDRLLRMAGRNLDVWTAARQEEDRDDEGECSTYKGETPYPWEMTGCFQHGTDIATETSDSDVLHTKALAKIEPKNNDQQPFLRYEEYGGYLGQPKMRTVVLPPDSKANSAGTRRYSDQDKDLGVFREQISMDGGWAVESAKSVYIAKRSTIANPKRIKPSDDYSKQCDSAENNNYKFAGLHGSGDAHKIGELSGTEEKHHLFSAAAILDYHAFAFNWKNVHPFHYHKKDFYFPQEKDLKLTTNQYLPPFGDLSRKMWLDAPTAKEMTVDHRYDKAKYYEVLSHISLTDDGAVVIQGGQGEEIKMAGGGIQISAPGKILIQSGNTTAILAGDDFVARAFNSADITATNKDVRLKAENNLQILAGNSGTGSLLLENRAKGTDQNYPSEGGETIKGSGIILKAPGSQVAALAKDVYLRSGIGASGQIILDGSKGNGNIKVLAHNLYRFVTGRIQDAFGIPANIVNVYMQGQTILGGQLQVNGTVLADGGGIFSSSVVSVNGRIGDAVGGEVGRLQPSDRGQANAELNAMDVALGNAAEFQNKDYDTEVDKEYYQEGKIGADDTISNVSFSLRPEKQYGTEDNFELPQTHWQILNNVVQAGQSWTEKDVEYQRGTKYQPWPGKQAWSEQDTLLTLPKDQFKFYDIEKGVARDRPGPYESKQLGAFVKKKPSSSYMIIPGSDQ